MTHQNESYNIEYKETIPKKPNQLKAEIVSFLNSSTGGTIFLGARDDGTVVEFSSEGQRKETYKEWEELISNWIATAFRPEVTGLIMVDPNTTPFTISISVGTNKPYYYTDGEGLNTKGVYIRNGSTKRLASDAEITRMMKRQITNTFDSEKIDTTKLSFDYVERAFKKEAVNFDEIRLDFKRNEQDKYNNAALIVSDENPFVAKAAVFNGLDVATFKDKKQFTGSIAKQIDDALQYIHLNNQKHILFGQGGKRIENDSYPIGAIREAVVNAFIHRDYTMSSDIKIEIYDDRIAISSPGSLPDGLTVEDIKNGANAKRNPILINALDKMNYIENYGSGIRRIFLQYEGFEQQPVLLATHNLFTVIMYNRNYHKEKSKQGIFLSIDNLDWPQKAVMLHIYEHGRINVKIAAKLLGKGTKYSRNLLRRMAEADLIIWVGTGSNDPTQHYVLANQREE